jgi:hypothetical protein
MRVRHGCLLVVCLLLVCPLVCGCGATSLFGAGPEARRVDTALSLARYLEDQAFQAVGTAAETECYPSGGSGWRCLVFGLVTDDLAAEGQPISLDIAYRNRRFVERRRSAATSQLPIVSAAGPGVLEAKAVEVRDQFGVDSVVCADTKQAAWCDQHERYYHLSRVVPLTRSVVRLSPDLDSIAALIASENTRDCDQPPYCAPPSSAFK